MSDLNLIKSIDKRVHSLENKIFIVLITMITNLITTISILILK